MRTSFFLLLVCLLLAPLSAQDERVAQAREAITAGKEKGAVGWLLGMLRQRAKVESELELSWQELLDVSDALTLATEKRTVGAIEDASARKSWVEAYFAARALGRLPGRFGLVERALADEQNAHRRLGAADGLRHWEVADEDGRSELLELLGRARNDARWEVRVAALQAADAHAHDDFEGFLIRFLAEGDEGDVRARAVTMELLQARVIRNAKKGKPRDEAKALAKQLGYDAQAWIEWGRSRQAGKAFDPGQVTSYYGIPVLSQRVAFLIDVSGSMNKPIEGVPELSGKAVEFEDEKLAEIYRKWRDRPVSKRLEAAQRELIVAVCELPEETEFTAVFYRDDVTYWERELMKATEENKLECCKAVERLGPTGETNIYDALAGTLRFSPDRENVVRHDKKINPLAVLGGVDTIFLLSDGAPTRGATSDRAEIRREMSKVHALRKVVIHTIHMGQRSAFMSGLAKDTGGTFVSVK